MQPSPAYRQISNLLAVCLLINGLLGVLFSGYLNDAHADGGVLDRVQAVIKSRLDGQQLIPPLACQGEMICGIRMLPIAYRKNDFRPLWLDASLRLEKGESLAQAIGRAEEDGLEAKDYHLDVIGNLLADLCEQSSARGPQSITPELWADLDLILTDAFLLYGSHLSTGRVNPETLHPDWKINPDAVDLLEALDRAASTGEVSDALAGLRPPHKEYRDLRNALAGLRTLAANGGWPMLEAQTALRREDRGESVGTLRQRLTISGDLDPFDPVDDRLLFDAPLEAGVKRFQYRNGLKTDGVVGPRTRNALNVGVTRRIQQVSLNLERWRWLPHDLGVRYIVVNTADFTLTAVDNSHEVLRMRVVVGRPARRSPVFSAKMTYLVTHPFWNVPTTIAVEDILPEVQKDPTYLTSRGIHVFRGWEADAAELDPATIDWQAYHANRFPFRLRQDPGPYNALGRIKFMFPNLFAVYLHGTPNHSLFNRVQRDLSSGCIRLESPNMLADFVLQGDGRWNLHQLNDILDKNETRVIHLSRPLPVHLLYMTAWVDSAGTLQFREDIYERDRDLAYALSLRRPNTTPAFVRD